MRTVIEKHLAVPDAKHNWNTVASYGKVPSS